MKFSDIHIRAISQEMPQPSITKICLKITCLKYHSNFQGVNELTITFIFQVFLWNPTNVNKLATSALAQGFSVAGQPNTQIPPVSVAQALVPLGVTPSHMYTYKAFYGIIFDAGSTGTRIQCFTFSQRDAGELNQTSCWPKSIDIGLNRWLPIQFNLIKIFLFNL